MGGECHGHALHAIVTRQGDVAGLGGEDGCDGGRRRHPGEGHPERHERGGGDRRVPGAALARGLP